MDESRELLLYHVKVFSVVPKLPSLANGRFVEDLCHPADKLVIISGFLDDDAFLLGLADEVPSARFDLLLPPLIVTLDWKDGEFLPLGMKEISWCDVRHSLPKCQNVSSNRALFFEYINSRNRISKVFIPLIFQAYGVHHAPIHDVGLTAEIKAAVEGRLPFFQC